MDENVTLYKIEIDDFENKTEIFKVFETYYKLEEYIDYMEHQKTISAIKDYNMTVLLNHKIHSDELDKLSTAEILEKISFVDFCKLVKAM